MCVKDSNKVVANGNDDSEFTDTFYYLGDMLRLEVGVRGGS